MKKINHLKKYEPHAVSIDPSLPTSSRKNLPTDKQISSKLKKLRALHFSANLEAEKIKWPLEGDDNEFKTSSAS